MVEKTKKFPQADSIDKLLFIINNFESEDLIDKKLIMNKLNLVERQVDYYIDALYFLDIIDEKNNFNDVGFLIKKGDYNEKVMHIRNLILNRPVFNTMYKEYLIEGSYSEKNVEKNIKLIFDLSESTILRRSRTVRKWFKWLSDNKAI